MSYDISLLDPVTRENICFEAAHQINGGTYVIEGTNEEAWLNITYNYAYWYDKPGVFPAQSAAQSDGDKRGIRSIYGMTGAESIPILQHAISALESCEEDISEEERKKCEQQGATGYWMPTKANALRPLYGLLAFAQMRPDGVWRVE